MDDRDFIYWLNGIFEFVELDVLKSEQIDQIMENIIEVYDNVQRNGVMNDFDSMRIIAFIEGSLMYYDEAPIEHKVKVTTLIKNEIKEMYYRFRDNVPDRLPLFRQGAVTDMLYPDMNVDIIPLTPEIIESLKADGITHIELPEDKSKTLIDTFTKILKGDSLKESTKKKFTSEEAMPSPDPLESAGQIDQLFGEQQEMALDPVNSLDAIADKIASRA